MTSSPCWIRRAWKRRIWWATTGAAASPGRVAAKAPERLLLADGAVDAAPGGDGEGGAHRHPGHADPGYMLFFQLPWLPEKLLDPATPPGRRRLVRSLRRSGLDEEAREQSGRRHGHSRRLHRRPQLVSGLAVQRPVAGPVTTPTLYIWGKRRRLPGTQGGAADAHYVTGPYEFRELPGDHWIQDDVVTPAA